MEEIIPTPTTEPENTPLPAPDPTAINPKRPSLLIWSILVVVSFALGMGAGYLLLARPQETRAAIAEQKLAAVQKTAVAGENTAAQTTAEAPQQVKRYDIPITDHPILGNENAPITLVEFSDYECPFCRQWHQQVWPQIQAKYGDKVRLVYRDFPLASIHADATAASEAADCAGEQKHYFEYNDLLFNGGKPLSRETFDAYAQQLNLDQASFKKCVDERRYQKNVQSDVDFAGGLGVRSTPTFFINGLAVVGAQPFEVFQQVIDLELAGKIPK